MSRGRHRSGRRSRPPGGRRFLLFGPRRPPGRRRSSGRVPARPAPDRELAALAAGLATLPDLLEQVEQLRLDVAVLGGRLDAVAARIERLAAAPPPAVVPAVPAPPSPRPGPSLRLPLVRAALAEPVADEPVRASDVA